MFIESSIHSNSMKLSMNFEGDDINPENKKLVTLLKNGFY